MRKFLVTLILVVCATMAREQRAIGYDWSFPQGNLIANWSFENESVEACSSFTVPEIDINCHFSAPSSALSGSRVMKASLVALSIPYTVYVHFTDYLRVEEGQNYSLSVRVNLQVGSFGALGKIRPAVEFRSESKQPIDTVPLDFYGLHMNGTIGEWQAYDDDFTAPAGAAFVRIILISFEQTDACALLFDNFLVSPVANPTFVEERTYTDAAGEVEKSVLRDDSSDVVRFTTYDIQRRPVQRYVPVYGGKFVPPGSSRLPLFTVGASPPPNSTVQDFATLDEAYAALIIWAGGHTSSQIVAQDMRIVVVVDSTDPLIEPGSDIATVMSGDPIPVPVDFSIDGIHRGTQAYLDLLALIGFPSAPPSTNQPSDFDDPEQVVAAGIFGQNYPGESHFFSEERYPNAGVNTFGETALPGSGYAMAQGKTDKNGWAFVADTNLLDVSNPGISDVEIASTSLIETDPEPYLYQWSRDRQGNYAVSFTGTKGLLEKSAVQKSGGWVTTAYSYDVFNRSQKTISPEGKEIQVTAFDGKSRAVEVLDPDRGTLQSIYDDRDRLRFTKNSANLHFSAIKYDILDRVLGVAKINNGSEMTQLNADNPFYPAISALEQGTVYDELTSAAFSSRTGLQPSDIGLNLAWLKNNPGKVVMTYKRNQEATVGGLSSPDKLVACFYSYDVRSRLTAKWDYLGPAPAGHKWHKIEYLYDEQDRLERRVVYKDAGTTLAQAMSYRYDTRGRLSKVVDETGVPPEDALVYHYDPLDRMAGASLYGAVQMSYGYDIQGKPLSIEGDAGGKNIFAEYLGYEGLANPQLPGTAPSAPARFDGKIGSTLMKYSLGALGANPVEYKTFAYRPDGPLSETKRYQGSALNTGTGEIDFTQLALGPTPVQTLDYAYRIDGGFSGQSIDNATGNDISQAYAYQVGTHQLSSVTKTEGAASATSTFTYDGEGRLTNQTGPNAKTLTYGFLGMPVDITAGSVKQHYFYGPDNYRVATYTENTSTSTITEKKVYVYEEGLKVTKEIRDNGTVVKTRVNLHGQDDLIGLMDEDTQAKRFLVKDHLGSIVQVISDNASLMDETFFADYGDLTKKVVSGDLLNPSEGWTGKEYDTDIALAYFGARFYDPILGMWLMTDPASQFFNPYAHQGNPVSYVDKDGEFFWLIIAGLIGAGIGAVQGYNAGASGWTMAGYVVGGATIGVLTGVGAAALAPIAAGAATTVAGALGLSSGSAAFYGAVAGGAITGASAGAASYSGHYALGMSLGDPNLGNFWSGLGRSAAFGAVLGAAVNGGLYTYKWATGSFKSGVTTNVVLGTRNPSGLAPRLTVQARGANALSEAGQALDRGGLTKAGRALEKHGSREGSVFPKATGDVSAKNIRGQEELNDIVQNAIKTSPNRFGGLDYYGGARGGGARFDGQGNFMGFLEP
jgi:RHS repeat-associated protein